MKRNSQSLSSENVPGSRRREKGILMSNVPEVNITFLPQRAFTPVLALLVTLRLQSCDHTCREPRGSSPAPSPTPSPIPSPAPSPAPSPLPTTTPAPVPSPPAAPSNLLAIRANSTRVNLSRRDNANYESGFVVQRLITSTKNSSWTTIAQVGANVPTFSDIRVSSRRKYNYRVYAFNTVGSSGFGNTATPTAAAALSLMGTTTKPKGRHSASFKLYGFLILE